MPAIARVDAEIETTTTGLVLPLEIFVRVVELAQFWEQSVPVTLGTLVTRGLRDAETCAVCRVCGCAGWDACVDEEAGETCGWASLDLCTRCAGRVESPGSTV